jgi:hypothetical protein
MMLPIEAPGVTFNIAFRVTPPRVADISTGVAVLTGYVVITNSAESVELAGTFTSAGTEATAGLLDDNVMVAPADVAALDNVTRLDPSALPPTAEV